MSFFDQACDIWATKMNELSKRPWAQRLNQKELGLAHYKGFLVETYHNAGLNPQLQGYTTLYIKNRPREVIKKFFQHAISEIGHDTLALNDLEHLGVKKSDVLTTRPLPETKAFYANTVFNIQTRGPASYLSYLFHLEYTPVQNGSSIMNMLTEKGVPSSALSFLEEHSTVDINHLKLMKSYMDEIIVTEADKKIFQEDLEDSMVLHTHLLEAAFENGEKNY